MALISLQNLTLNFSGTPILENVTFHMEKGQRICILGRNGAGKTTLMRTIAGELQPDSGVVQFQQGVKVAYFAQNISSKFSGSVFDIIASGLGEKGKLLLEYYREEQKLISDPHHPQEKLSLLRDEIESKSAWNILDEIGKIASRMDIDQNWVYEDLSGGQKRRVLLASALVSDPDVLLLDEPTNHLDIETIAWMEEFLLRTNVSMMFVTHDRALLRRLATRIVEIDRGKLFDWACDYDTFLARKAELLAAEEKDWERFDKKLAQEEVWIRKGIQARRTRNEGRVRALKKMREERRQRRYRQGKAKISVAEGQISGNDIIEAKHISFSYPGKKIINDFNLSIVRGDKIGVIGPNGCGKTTLIKVLLGELKPERGEIKTGVNLEVTYFDQLRNCLDESKTIWENVLPGGDTLTIDGKDTHIITYLQNFLFTPERAKTKVSILSGGEKNRVMLAKLFAQPTNFLVMDEPTNDLDIETLELLEELLASYTGTVLLICHDRTFLSNVVSSTIVFGENGEVREIVGGYEDWIEEKRQLALELEEKAKEEKEKARSEKELKKAKKMSFKEKQELERIPGQIEKIELEIGSLQEKLGDPEFYKSGEDISAVKSRLDELEETLLTSLERWEELEGLK